MRHLNYKPAVAPLDVGTPVLSHYRAHWAGIVIGYQYRGFGEHRHDVTVVLVTIDRRGRPLRKPIRKTLDAAWLEELPL